MYVSTAFTSGAAEGKEKWGQIHAWQAWERQLVMGVPAGVQRAESSWGSGDKATEANEVFEFTSYNTKFQCKKHQKSQTNIDMAIHVT